jgi:hypothetical protein
MCWPLQVSSGTFCRFRPGLVGGHCIRGSRVLAVARREFLTLPLKTGGKQVIYDIKSVLGESNGSL